MVYLDVFTFPDEDKEFDFFMNVRRTCFDSRIITSDDVFDYMLNIPQS